MRANAHGIELAASGEHGHDHPRRRGPAGHRAAQPAGERGRLQPGEDPGPRLHPAGRRRHGRDQRGRPGHRHPRARPASASSSGSTGSTRPGRGPPAGPASAWPSPSTSRRRTAARITVWSKEGAGSTFTLRLPLQKLFQRAAWRPADMACTIKTGATCQGDSQVTRVLVVEDEESFSDALSYMLRKEGFEVAVCPTGPDAHRDIRPDRRRPGAARPHAARPARQRGLPEPARAVQRPGHHADRQGQRDRQGRRPGARRRRLRDQAVLLPRAGRQDPGRAAAPRATPRSR